MCSPPGWRLLTPFASPITLSSSHRICEDPSQVARDNTLTQPKILFFLATSSKQCRRKKRENRCKHERAMAFDWCIYTPILGGNKCMNFMSLLPPASAVEVIESDGVRFCVCVYALSRLNRLTYDLDFWYGS